MGFAVTVTHGFAFRPKKRGPVAFSSSISFYALSQIGDGGSGYLGGGDLSNDFSIQPDELRLSGHLRLYGARVFSVVAAVRELAGFQILLGFLLPPRAF